MRGEPFHHARRNFLAGSDTARNYLERRLARLQAVEPTLRAFVQVDMEGARREADGATARYRSGAPLSEIDGMPLGIKDVIETADLPTQMGSARFAGWRPDRDAACVAALKKAGAIVLGKTVTTEFAVGSPGPTTNPFDAARTPGGSSSGSAAAVAAGIVPAALGTQEMGSLLRPASFCGVLGFKPSFGALPLGGVHAAAPSQCHLGVIAQSLPDLVGVLKAMGAEAPSKPVRPERPGFLRTRSWERMESTARRSFEDFVARFDVVEIKDDFAGALDVWAAICCWELRWPLAQYRDDLGADTKRFLDMGERMSRADYERALARRVELRLQYGKLAEQADVLVLPAATGPAPLGVAGTGSREFNAFSSGFGAPAITLPLLQVDGLPLGVQLMGFAGADARLLGHAAWLLATSSGTSS